MSLSAGSNDLSSFERYFQERGATTLLRRILIASNGLMAVNALRDLRRWAYQTFRSPNLLQLVVMATPEDIAANAEYLRLADEFVHVEGGLVDFPCQVDLITSVAIRLKVDAVWPGAGASASDPQLPAQLAESGIAFIGPHNHTLHLLHDQVSALLLAESLGMSTLAWSGIRIQEDHALYTRQISAPLPSTSNPPLSPPSSFTHPSPPSAIPPYLLRQAAVFSLSEALQSAEKLGYPVLMLIPGESQGKRSIRIHTNQELEKAYLQATSNGCASSVYLQTAPSSRSIYSIMVLGDTSGGRMALMGAHLNILEEEGLPCVCEGPLSGLPTHIRHQLHSSALTIANHVGLVGAASVQFAYHKGEFLFLGVVPHLDLHYPVHNAITRVNIVATQLTLAMGVPLQMIPAIRRIYGKAPEDTDTFPLDLIYEGKHREVSRVGHCICTLITTHSPDSDTESHGVIQEIHLASNPGVFSTMSVGSEGRLPKRPKGSAIVLGQITAFGIDRASTMPLLLDALSEISLRGQVTCNAVQLGQLFEHKLRPSSHSVTLSPLSMQTPGGGGETGPGNGGCHLVGRRVNTQVAVVCAAICRAHLRRQEMQHIILETLTRGVSPDVDQVNFSEHSFDLVCESTKYLLKVSMSGPTLFTVRVNADASEAEVIHRPDGGMLVMLDGRTHLVYYESGDKGLKVHINGKQVWFPDDFDPCALVSPCPGKLLAWLVEEGQRVAVGQPYVELELMKTRMPVLSSTQGIVHRIAIKGTHLRTGDIIARVVLEDSCPQSPVAVFRGSFPELTPRHRSNSTESNDKGLQPGSPFFHFNQALQRVFHILAGYEAGSGDPLQVLLDKLKDPQIILFDLLEQKWKISPRTTAVANEALKRVVNVVKQAVAQGSTVRSGLHGDPIVFAATEAERFLTKFPNTSFPEIQAFVDRYHRGLFVFEVDVLSKVLEEFVEVEEGFSEEPLFEDAMLRLAKQNAGNLGKVIESAHSHSKLHSKLQLITRVLNHIETHSMVESPVCQAQLHRIAALSGVLYSEVAGKAKKIIIKKQEYARYSARKWKNLKKSISVTMDNLNNAMRVDEDGTPLANHEGLETSVMGTRTESSPTITRPSPPFQTPFASGRPGLEHVAGGLTGMQKKRALLQKMKRSTQELQHELRLSELQCVPNPGKTAADIFMMMNALFNRDEPGIATAAIKKLFAVQGFPDVVCTVEDGMIRAHLSNNIDTWFLASLEEAKKALQMGLAHNLDQVMGLFIRFPEIINNPNMDEASSQILEIFNSTSREIPLDMAKAFVCLMEPTQMDREMWLHYRREPPGGRKWCEELNVRGVGASFVTHLELMRMSCFNASLIAASDSLYSSISIPLPFMSYQPEYSTLIFLATERKPPLKGTRRDQRIFLRTVVHNKELFIGSKEERVTGTTPAKLPVTKSNRSITSSSRTVSRIFSQVGNSPEDECEKDEDVLGDDRVLADLMAQMELAVMSKKTAFNYMFVNLSKSNEGDIPAVKSTVQAFLNQCRRDLRRLRVAWIEVKMGPGRLVAYNPTGYQFKVEFHMDAKPPLPYPVLNRIQRKRMYAQSLGTTFVYDFVDMFHFHAAALMTADTDDLSTFTTEGLGNSFHASELVLNSEGELEEISRPIGGNDVGMVVWKCKALTREYPSGRSFILVANDVTHVGGSFSPEEDDVYEKAVKTAQNLGIPLLFISANTGARVGLDEVVKSLYKVEWEDPADPSQGAKYFYLTEEDYNRIRRSRNILATRMVHEPSGQVRWLLKDMVGGIGHECLKGSAMIASATSSAYHDIFTLTYVTGRSIGIGAYISRLSTRVIQHQEAPIILTDVKAINKILGREVYSNNNQIGGPKVMYHNGVTHMVVQDDLQGVGAMLKWLSYIPCCKGAPLPYTCSKDPVGRRLAFQPSSAPHDPRLMLDAFFDRASFSESMAEWGKTVVTGRARLGGLPVGVVAVENRVTEKMVPADPAFAGAQQLIEQQPGQVWFPDSAFKTAQAISDFNYEGLPLIIFANWRGFAGGLRDMFGEVLKYGSMIVDNLREYRQPVIVYIPYSAEIRGGAWVVIDSSINPEQMEMYAAESCRGGVLEPENIVELKYTEDDLLHTMQRLRPELQDLPPDVLEKKKKELLPAFKHLAVQFAAMHDTPKVMLEKKIISGIVQWADSRSHFGLHLRKRMAEHEIKRRVLAVWPGPSGKEHAKKAVKDLENHIESVIHHEGEVKLDFLDVKEYMAKVRKAYIVHAVTELATEDLETVTKALEKYVFSKMTAS